MEFRKSYKIELTDYQRYNLFCSKKQLVLMPTLFVVFVPMLILFVFKIDTTLGWVLILIIAVLISAIFAGLMTVLNIVLLKRISKKQYDSSKTIQAENELVIDKTGVRESNIYGNMAIEWTDIFKVAESKHAIYMHISKLQAFIIPKGLLNQQEDSTIRTLARENLPIEKYRLKK